MSEISSAKRVNDWWKAASPIQSEWYRAAEVCQEFYLGTKQWTDEDVRILRERKQAPVTINEILPKVHTLTGIERQNRHDIAVYPRRGGTHAVAVVLTELSKHALDLNRGDWVLSDAFLNGLVLKKGWISLDIDYGDDAMHGDILIENVSPFLIVEDPETREYDLNKRDGAQYIFRLYYWSAAEIELNYPKYGKKLTLEAIEDASGAGDIYSENSAWPEFRRAGPSEDYVRDEMPDDAAIGGVGGEEQERRYLVRECWWKSYERRALLFSRESDLQVLITDAGDIASAEKLVAAEDGWGIRTHIVPELHRTVTCGNAVLADEESPYGAGDPNFRYYRFAPYFSDGKIIGFVDNMLDLQREINKRRSQALAHLNASTNSGWKYRAGVMSEPQKRDLEDFGSRPGFQLEYAEEPGPQQIFPQPLDSAHVALGDKATKDMDRLAVNEELRGLESRAQSGYAIQLRQQQGLLNNEVVMDNWRHTKAAFGEGLIDVIRRPQQQGRPVYSDEEVMRIVDKEQLIDKETIEQAQASVQPLDVARVQMLPPETQQMVLDDYRRMVESRARELFFEKLRSWAAGRYGIRIVQRPTSVTTRLFNYEMLLELYKLAPQLVPVEFLIEQSDYAKKEELIERIRENQQRMMEQAQSMQSMQTARTG